MAKGLNYELVIDAAAVERRLSEAGQSFGRYKRQWMIQSANLIRKEVERRAPVGVGGHAGQGLSNNIQIDYNGDYTTATIGPNRTVAKYARAVEKGTRPHKVPHGPESSLAQWAELKGLSVWAVAKGIEKRGTKAHPYMAPAYQAVKGRVQRAFSDGVSAYIARFA